MLEKLELHDVVTALLHGTLLIGATVVLFPKLLDFIGMSDLPEGIPTLFFLFWAYFIGQVLVALSSFSQDLLYRTWGGKPSDHVFDGTFPEKYLPADSIKSAKCALQKRFGEHFSDRALFSVAMGIARKAEGSLSERHNQMYSYNRVCLTNLLIVSCLFAVSCFRGRCATLTGWEILVVAGGLLVLVFLHWYRAKQRAHYYVSEVVRVAERELAGGE